MKNEKGITDLKRLLQHMEPVLNKGEYVFATVKEVSSIPRDLTICEFREKEGTTIIVSKKDAQSLGLLFNFVAAWITLSVHSALEAVGLTAAFATALAKNGISCNVIAGYYHDHIFVDHNDSDKAMRILQALSEKDQISS